MSIFKPVQIGMADVQDALKKAIIDKGEDYEYPKVYNTPHDHDLGIVGTSPRCVYFDAAGSPSCLVGHVLSTLGVAPLPYGSMANQSNVVTLMDNGVIEFKDWSPESKYSYTLDLLDRAQGLQDDQVPWGTVVQKANEHIIENGYGRPIFTGEDHACSLNENQSGMDHVS